MRTVKVPLSRFEYFVNAQGQHCKFVKIPSSKEGYAFQAMVMTDGAWIAWPETKEENEKDGLTDQEFSLYKEMFGSPPDIFNLGPDTERGYLNVVKDQDDNKKE
jgi:hypothetical protein